MALHWLDKLLDTLANNQSVIRVVLVRAEGSTPREMGASMMIYEDHFTGTIGGGTLEYEVLKAARNIIAEPRKSFRSRRQYPLGPTLGQCCGGFVEIMFEHITPEDTGQWRDISQAQYIFYPDDVLAQPSPASTNLNSHGITMALREVRTPLYLYGAGHVGRALMMILNGLPLDRYWVDTDASRFPLEIPDGITPIIATHPAQVVSYAESQAIHLVMSYSHQIDLDICLAVLKADNFTQLGLIGSATKKTRFLKALSNAGINDHQLKRLVCPIGLAEIGGKEPVRVALSIAGQLSEWTRGGTLNQDQLEHDHYDIA